MQRKALITGGGGFLGSHIGERLVRGGWEVTSLCGMRTGFSNALGGKFREVAMTLPNPDLLEILRQTRPDTLIHCAGTSLVGPTFESPMTSYENMVSLSMHILESVRRASPDTHIVFLSSAAVYGKPRHLPVREDSELAPISPYGTFKYMTELLVNEYRRSFGISGTNVRIFSAYGERLYKQVLWDLCCRATEEQGEALTVRGNPSDTRDFIHVSDIARAVELVSRRRLNDVVNLGSGKETEIQKIAWIIRDILSPTKEVVFTGSELQGYPARWSADMHRLASLGFSPRMTLERGLENYCLWFAREHKSSERSVLPNNFEAKVS